MKLMRHLDVSVCKGKTILLNCKKLFCQTGTFIDKNENSIDKN